MRNHESREREMLEYQEAMLSELCRMASENKHEVLGYLLGMAYIEVCERLGRPAGAFPQPPASVPGLSTRN